MSTPAAEYSTLSIPRSLRVIGILGGAWAIFVILAAVIAYLPEHPDFSPFTTYLSDIGDTPGWPQILFNSGTLIAVPIRYLVLVLLALRLMQLGAGRSFAVATLVVGFFSTAGTALMTATLFSIAPTIHKMGIALYFLGVVVLQSLICAKEWSLKEVPRVLPMLSLVMVVLYVTFATLLSLYEQGVLVRSTPVIWEWLSIFSSIVWMLAQSVLLGKADLSEYS